MRRECRERFSRHRLRRKPLVSDPGMHRGTCVTNVPWCMSGSQTRGGGENVPGIPGACATLILRIWQKAHWTFFRILDWTCYHWTQLCSAFILKQDILRGVPCLLIDCPCGVCCLGLTNCVLHVTPCFGYLVLNKSWFVSCIFSSLLCICLRLYIYIHIS